MIHDEKDPRWLLQDEVVESLQLLSNNNIPYDIVGVLPAHIETALKLAEKIPSLKMVFDHLNQPPIAEQSRYGKWCDLMKAAATHPNFYAKISGLGTTAKKQDRRCHTFTSTSYQENRETAQVRCIRCSRTSQNPRRRRWTHWQKRCASRLSFQLPRARRPAWQP